MTVSPERQKLAEIFRDKSDESFVAAQECFQNGRYRATCNRAWYAIYQAIAAGVYARLRQDLPKEKDHWNHNSAEVLFNNFLKASNMRIRYGFLAESLVAVRATRVLADYLPDKDKIKASDAEATLMTAERIRRVIYEVMDSNGNGDR